MKALLAAWLCRRTEREKFFIAFTLGVLASAISAIGGLKHWF